MTDRDVKTASAAERYRDSIAPDSDSYRDMLARAMRCDDDCTCRGADAAMVLAAVRGQR